MTTLTLAILLLLLHRITYTSINPLVTLVCTLLFDTGLFQAALSLAVVLYKGLSLTQALEVALAAMATACVQKQLEAAQDHIPSTDSNLVFGQASNLQGDCVALPHAYVPCYLKHMKSH